jgi:hypothetical protein
MAAEHNDNGSFVLYGGDDGVNDLAEIARHQDVWQRVEEGVERAILARWMRELARAHLVRALRDRDGADAREVGFGRPA